jgi:hypothetical protein
MVIEMRVGGSNSLLACDFFSLGSDIMAFPFGKQAKIVRCGGGSVELYVYMCTHIVQLTHFCGGAQKNEKSSTPGNPG